MLQDVMDPPGKRFQRASGPPGAVSMDSFTLMPFFWLPMHRVASTAWSNRAAEEAFGMMLWWASWNVMSDTSRGSVCFPGGCLVYSATQRR